MSESTFLHQLPEELFGLIIPHLNRSDIVPLLEVININESVFKNIILFNDNEKYKSLILLKEQYKLSWTHVCLLLFELVTTDTYYLECDRCEKNICSAFLRLYIFQLEYPELYLELIKFIDPINLISSNPYFYLKSNSNEFNWDDLRMDIMDPYEVIENFVESYIDKGIKCIDTYLNEILKTIEKHNNFHRVSVEYYNNKLFMLLELGDEFHIKFTTKLIQHLYNYNGYANSLTHMKDFELFKWFHCENNYNGITNTYGEIDYTDVGEDELIKSWLFDYENAHIGDFTVENQIIEYISTKYPWFDKDKFYQKVKLYSRDSIIRDIEREFEYTTYEEFIEVSSNIHLAINKIMKARVKRVHGDNVFNPNYFKQK